jgi:hypothetical protein
VSQRLALFLVLLGTACGGGPGSTVPQDFAATPEIAVRDFMQAVTDSNITRMGRYWGSSKGPASETGQPADYVQRLSVTQAFLRASPYRILRSDPVPNQPDRHTVEVELSRTDVDGSHCVRNLPFTMVNTKRGWIVTAIDITQAGTPGRSCLSQPKTAAPTPGGTGS